MRKHGRAVSQLEAGARPKVYPHSAALDKIDSSCAAVGRKIGAHEVGASCRRIAESSLSDSFSELPGMQVTNSIVCRNTGDDIVTDTFTQDSYSPGMIPFNQNALDEDE